MTQLRIGTSPTNHPSPTPVTADISRFTRHGLIAGATGTGKTVTLQTLAEQLAQSGTNVFVTDVKGDLSGIAAAGQGAPWVVQAYQTAGVPYAPAANPAHIWSLTSQPHTLPARITVSALGASLTARLLNLNDVQTGVLHIIFTLAQQQGTPLTTLTHLRQALAAAQANAKQIAAEYGAISSASVASIQRAILAFQQEGLDSIFSQPALNLQHLLQTQGTQGVVHILHSAGLMANPRTYGVFMLFMLHQLFAQLPEVGDLPQPKLVLFLDEAHLLFNDADEALLEKTEQVIRLIRSKGVGIWLVTQQPSDVPHAILAQLGNRIQHALRAATPQGQKDIKVAASTMASNPAFNAADVIPQLAIGEALVSTLDKAGVPQPAQRTFILPPRSFIGPLPAPTMQQLFASSSLAAYYAQPAPSAAPTAAPVFAQPEPTSTPSKKEAPSAIQQALWGTSRRQGLVEAAAKSVVRQAAGPLGRALVRGLFSALSKRG